MGQLETLARVADRLSNLTGRLVSWFTLAMVLITCFVVFARYALDLGWIWLQELVIWMHALVFLLGAAYTLRAGEHVRVDVFYRRMGARGRAWVDLLGTFVLLAPTCVYFIISAWPYVLASWQRGEGSREPGGLPFPFVPMAKTAIVIMAVLVLLQGLAMVLRAVATLRTPPGDAANDDEPPHTNEALI